MGYHPHRKKGSTQKGAQSLGLLCVALEHKDIGAVAISGLSATRRQSGKWEERKTDMPRKQPLKELRRPISMNAFRRIVTVTAVVPNFTIARQQQRMRRRLLSLFGVLLLANGLLVGLKFFYKVPCNATQSCFGGGATPYFSPPTPNHKGAPPRPPGYALGLIERQDIRVSGGGAELLQLSPPPPPSGDSRF